MMEAILHADVPYAQLPAAIHAVRRIACRRRVGRA